MDAIKSNRPGDRPGRPVATAYGWPTCSGQSDQCAGEEVSRALPDQRSWNPPASVVKSEPPGPGRGQGRLHRALGVRLDLPPVALQRVEPQPPRRPPGPRRRSASPGGRLPSCRVSARPTARPPSTSMAPGSPRSTCSGHAVELPGVTPEGSGTADLSWTTDPHDRRDGNPESEVQR